MSTTLLTLQAGTLPSGYCWPESPQTLINDALAISSAVFGGEFQTFNVGDTTPAAADRDKPWIRTVNGQLEGLYVYDSGYWLRPHAVPAGSNARWLWVGTTTELLTFDGGVSEAVADFTGPMWEVDTDFAGRSPMGPGTLPLSSTVVGVASNYGADQITLATTQLPAHNHTIANCFNAVNTLAAGTGVGTGIVMPSAAGVTDSTGGGLAHDNLHPVRGCYIIKRTSRIFLRQTA